MRGYLLDTHVWLWLLRGDGRLSTRSRELIASSIGECWLSPISIWEAGILEDRGKIELSLDFRQWVREAREKLPLQPAPLTAEVALVSFELDLTHRDPGDRFLAATARVFELALITADRRLLKSKAIETLDARG